MAARAAQAVRSATLDANVYISALEFGGIGARFIGMGRAGMVRIDSCDAILDETIGVLRDKFGWDGYRLQFARHELARLANVVVPKRTLNAVVDPDDNRVIECAVEAGSEFILTSDNHLLRLGKFEGIPIITPGEFLLTASG